MNALLLPVVCGVLLVSGAACAWGAGVPAASAPLNVASVLPVRTVSEQYLFEAANEERVERGIPPLHWDNALFRAATRHAEEMAERQSISHQYPGEPELTERGELAGAHFSTIAENVAMAPSAPIIHNAWMNSEHHRENLLDPTVNAVGISVLSRNGELYAVEDFDRGVRDMSLDAQEQEVNALLAEAAPVRILPASEDSRRTCAMETGYAGARRPWFVMRYTASDLSRLPSQLTDLLASGRYREAAVGACRLRNQRGFTAFNIAVLLYP